MLPKKVSWRYTYLIHHGLIRCYTIHSVYLQIEDILAKLEILEICPMMITLILSSSVTWSLWTKSHWAKCKRRCFQVTTYHSIYYTDEDWSLLWDWTDELSQAADLTTKSCSQQPQYFLLFLRITKFCCQQNSYKKYFFTSSCSCWHLIEPVAKKNY